MLILAETNMPYKKIILFTLSLFYLANCFAQETVEKKARLRDKVTESFYVLKNDEQVKDGPYQAFYKKFIPIAVGNYTKGKKTGLWRFYGPRGGLLQTYNYDKDSLKYEAFEDTTSNLRYLIDRQISDTDKVTKPIKVGGRFYGYLPYLGLYQTPFSPYEYSTNGMIAVIELLISPLGRLADYKVHVFSAYSDYERTTTMDIHLFKEEDRQFISATFNHEPIQCRIVIKCKVTQNGGLDFLD